MTRVAQQALYHNALLVRHRLSCHPWAGLVEFKEFQEGIREWNFTCCDWNGSQLHLSLGGWTITEDPACMSCRKCPRNFVLRIDSDTKIRSLTALLYYSMRHVFFPQVAFRSATN